MATREQVQLALNLFERGKEVPGMVTRIAQPNDCNFCFRATALVDGKTVDGPWANMCAKCFMKYGVGLGVGRGQVLVWKSNV